MSISATFAGTVVLDGVLDPEAGATVLAALAPGDPGAQHADSSHDLRPPSAHHRPGVAAHDPQQPVALLGTDLPHLHPIGRRLLGGEVRSCLHWH